MANTAVAAVGSAYAALVPARPRPIPAPFGTPMADAEDTEPQYAATRLAAVIETQGLRLIWVAEQLGYHRSYVKRVMDGEKPITREFVRRCCTLFHLPPDALFIEAPPRVADD